MGSLVLTRREGEVVDVGDLGTVTVVRIKSDGVRLAFDFPRDVKINRREVTDAIAADGPRREEVAP